MLVATRGRPRTDRPASHRLAAVRAWTSRQRPARRARRRRGRVGARRRRRAARPSSPRRPGAADVRAALKKLTLLRPEAPGAGARRRPRRRGRARRRAPAGRRRPGGEAGGELEAESLAWVVPAPTASPSPSAAAALVEGTVLAAYRFDRFRSPRRRAIRRRPSSSASSCSSPRPTRDASPPRPRSRSVAARGGESGARSAEPARERAHPAGARRARGGDRRRARRRRASRSSTARRSPRAGMGGLVAVSQGSGDRAAADRAPLRRRRRRAAHRAGRQGGHVRQRRDLDQALRAACRR